MVRTSSRPGSRNVCIEALESRQLLSALPLHISGNHVVNSAGATVRLLGANCPSASWNNSGENLLPSIASAYDLWQSNCVRLPLSQDAWFGYRGQSDGGAAYRALVDQAVQLAADRNAYMIIDLHWSDEGAWGQNINQQRMADDNSTTFWNDVANRYKNNPSVLFELYNEPHDIDWNTWKNGGTVTDNVTYHTPGMQSLLNTVRATGATNICLAGGTSWAYDLSGVGNGYALSDSTGNIMYATHPYPWLLNWDSAFGNVSNTYAVMATEFGHWDPNDSGHNSLGWGDQDYQTWNPSILNYFDSKGISWTGWSFHNGATPIMISDWNYTPTYYWGQYAHDHLAQLASARTLGNFTSTATIGTSQPGTAYQLAGTSGTYFVNGGGTDIQGTADQFQYLYGSTSGDQTLVARVADFPSSEYLDATNAKAGVMFRNDNSPGSANVAIFTSPNNRVHMAWRDAANGSTTESSWVTTSTPMWVKLVRSGNTVSGYYATTTGTPSQSDWILIATHTTTLNSSYLAGLAVCARTASTTTGVTFTNVNLSSWGGAPAAPTNLSASTISSSQINLAWSAASGATSYNIYRSTSSGGEGSTPYATGITSTSYSDTACSASTTYYYTVAAVNSSGVSPQSSQTSATTSAQGTHLINFPSFTSTSGLSLSQTGGYTPAVNGTSLRLVNNANAEATSAWWNQRVSCTQFSTSFSFLVSGNAAADGFTFCLQNSSATALGANGGSLGYVGIANSVALVFNIYGGSQVGLYTNGSGTQAVVGGGVNFHAGDTINVQVSYSGTTLTVTLTDAAHPSQTYTTSYTVNISQAVGSSSAFAGFTAGTGGSSSNIDISSWAYDGSSDSGSSQLPNFSNFTSTNGLSLNHTGSYTPAVNGTSLRLVNNGTAEATSAWWNQRVNCTQFTSNFSFLVSGNAAADGFTFCLQNSSATALGANGGGWGYAGIANSVALVFNIFGGSQMGLYINGSGSQAAVGGGVNFHAGDTINVQLSYSGTTLTVTLTDAAHPTQTYTTSYNVNISQAISSSSVFAGFTAGTGASTSNIDIGSWTYSNSGSPQLPSFNSFTSTSGLSLNQTGGYTPAVSGSSLRLANNANAEATSAWWNQRVNCTQFSTSFSFLVSGNNAADGFTFCLQNSSATALGGNGGSLGYVGIANSVALAFNIYGGSQMGLYVNGSGTQTAVGGGVNFHAGDTINVQVSYSGTTLTVTLTDAAHPSQTYTTNYTVNISQAIGSSSAFVGFTAGTGGSTCNIDINSWTYTT